MKLSDKLKTALATVAEKMKQMAKDAEGRVFDETEEKAWTALETEAKQLRGQIETTIAREEAIRGETPAPGLIVPKDLAPGEVRAYTNKEKMFQPAMGEEKAQIGRFVRAIATHDWSRSQLELEIYRKALGESPPSSGAVLVPAELMGGVIDLARDASVMVKAGALTFPMSSQTLTVAKLLTDPISTWRAEHVAIPESDPTFGPLVYRARTLASLVRASVELAEDAPDMAQAIESAMSKSMALSLDRAAIAGDGVGEMPLGCLNTPGVGDEVAGGPLGSYAALVRAMGQVRAANENPTAVIMSSQSQTALDLLVDTLGQPIQAPQAYKDLTPLVTNAMPADSALVGDFTKTAFGIRTTATLEITRTGGDGTFKQLEILIRLYLRADFHVLRPAALCKITGITYLP